MRVPDNDVDSLFRIALRVRLEVDSLWFSVHHFDTGIVFIYAPASASPADAVSNFVHELAHARLSDTPLGFIHLSMFELAATASDLLWERCIYRQIVRHAPRNAALVNLATLLPRPPEQQDQTKEEADRLIVEAGPGLLEALASDTQLHGLACGLLDIQRRRRLLAESGRLCHEFAATHAQLRSCSDVAAWYASFLADARLMPSLKRAGDRLHAHIVAQRESLSGIWRLGYELASTLENKVNDPHAIFLLASIVHHVPYSGVRLLDCSLEEAKNLISGGVLDAEMRLRTALKHVDSTMMQSALAGNWRPVLELLSSGTPIGTSFRAWHDEHLMGSRFGRLVLSCVGRGLAAQGASASVDDCWDAGPMRLVRRLPPVIHQDGRVEAASPAEVPIVKRDFVRSLRLRSVERLLDRIGFVEHLQ